MNPFEPDDDDEHHFHAQFTGLRSVVIRVASDLAGRVKARVADAERPSPRLSDVVIGGLIEWFNALARSFGADRDDGGPNG